MKNLFLLTCFVLLMTSCSVKTYYQIVDVKSTNLQKESNNYVYNDGVCKIVYNFWSNGGNAGFSIENLSDDVIYVDLGNTFYIVNGIANDYYLARNYSFGKSSQISQGKSTGKSVGLLSGLSVSATAYGMWKGGTLDGHPGSISAQASYQTSSQLTSILSSTVSEGFSSNLSYAEKPFVAIPPHASKSFSEYKIMSRVIQDCSIRLRVKRNQPEGTTFEKSESPICFENYITYRVGDSETAKVVTNDFYIGGFTNYLSKDVEDKKFVGCKGSVLMRLNKEAAPDRFFVKYNQTHSRDYSADAIATSQSKSSKSNKEISSKKYVSVRKR